MAVKNVGMTERLVRLMSGAILIVLGLTFAGWTRWLGTVIALFLVLTGTIGH